MGDGNMHWATAMKNLDGMSTYAVPPARSASPR
jgi:hypothetical protein